jgi:hypothetical protein
MTEGPRSGYDDYGQELGRDSRVWKTYVKEAYRWDADLVDGWNRCVFLQIFLGMVMTVLRIVYLK